MELQSRPAAARLAVRLARRNGLPAGGGILRVAALLLILAVGAGFRLYDLGQVFVFADEALWAYYPLKLHTHSVLALPIMENPIAQILRWKYGYFYMAFLYLYTGLLSALGIPITEAALVLPVAGFGLGSLVLVHLIAREVGGLSRPGLVAPLLVAVLPLHVGLSRTMEVNRIPASFLLLLTLYLFLRYVRRPARGVALVASLSLAAYLVSHLEALGIVPLLLACGLLGSGPGERRSGGAGWAVRLRELRRLLIRPAILLLPALGFLPNVLVLLYTVHAGKIGGFLGYMLTRPKLPGFYPMDVVRHSVTNVGPVLLGACLLGAVYGLRRLWQGEKEAVLFCWAVIYLAPYVFVISEEVTGVREYLIHGTIPLIMLAASPLEAAFRRMRARWPGSGSMMAVAVVVLVLSLPTAHQTLRLVFNLGTDWRFGVQRYSAEHVNQKTHIFGSVRQDNGIKAAGFFVREEVPEPKRVFTDMTPLHGAYYLGRRVFAIYDAKLSQILECFQAIWPEVDYALVNAAHVAPFEAVLDTLWPRRSWHRVAEVTTGGEVVMVLYATDPRSQLVLRSEDLNPRFDRKYGWVGKLVREWGSGLDIGPPVLEVSGASQCPRETP